MSATTTISIEKSTSKLLQLLVFYIKVHLNGFQTGLPTTQSALVREMVINECVMSAVKDERFREWILSQAPELSERIARELAGPAEGESRPEELPDKEV